MMRELVRKGYALLTSHEIMAVLGPPLNIDKDMIGSDEKLSAVVEANSASAYHFVGTCRMAPEGTGVVDQSGRVYGITGLVIADASIIPTVPSANSMLPTTMTAERIARSLRDSVDVGCSLKPDSKL